MVDNIKFKVLNQDIIQRFINHSDFVICKPKNNYYYSVKHKNFGIKLSLDFRKRMDKGQLIGFTLLEINVSPHYHFNQYKHNGNDFTPIDCIKTIIDILTYLGIQRHEFNELKVCNIEYGLNIIPEMEIKNLLKGLIFYKKTSFKVGDFPYFKKTDATKYKQIKAYAKGLQFEENSHYGINPNTFRFEIKSKQSKYIGKLGITTAENLTKVNIYKILMQEIVREWDSVLLIHQTPDFSDLKNDELEFIKKAIKVDFWNDLIEEKHRNTFMLNKQKYFKILQRKNNPHTQIKGQIIDKLLQFTICANSTQGIPINTGKLQNKKTTSPLINLESAHLHHCLITGLDISMQKKGSKYLCFAGLKYYRENKIEIYKDLEKKYLSDKMKVRTIEKQMYYIAHNIRNSKTNTFHNQKRFEKRNYNPNQLQFQF